MPALRMTPAELVEALNDLARESYAATFPAIEAEETAEADAAQFIEAASKFLQEIAAAGGPLAGRARAILDRIEPT